METIKNRSTVVAVPTNSEWQSAFVDSFGVECLTNLNRFVTEENSVLRNGCGVSYDGQYNFLLLRKLLISPSKHYYKTPFGRLLHASNKTTVTGPWDILKVITNA